MQMEDLGRITGLRNEIKSIEEQIKDLEKWGTIPSVKNPYDVLSSGSSVRIPGNPTEAWVNKMWELRTELLEKKKMLLEEVVRIERWIDEIEDSQVKAIIRYHYILGYTWRQTAIKCCASEHKETAFLIVKRFVKSQRC